MKPLNKCVEDGCNEKPGQPPRRNPCWCAKHDEERIARGTKSMQKIMAEFDARADNG
jgi:hypothetical protein